jgi:phosphopantetheinyl transferase (holo-ACP synthase)
MNSTGNDVVSLNAIDVTRTLLPRFYSKILCAAEIALYESGLTQIPLEHYVWLLWSIKESAYKFLQRNNPDLVFSPTKFVVTRLEIPATKSLSSIEGAGFEAEPVYKAIVTIGSETLYSRSLVNDNFIFSVVNLENNFESTCWGVKSINNSNPDLPSIEVRKFLIDKLESFLPLDDLTVTKTLHGCPMLMNGDQLLNIPVSLAHHDRWVAYSFQLQEKLLSKVSSIHAMYVIVN